DEVAGGEDQVRGGPCPDGVKNRAQGGRGVHAVEALPRVGHDVRVGDLYHPHHALRGRFHPPRGCGCRFQMTSDSFKLGRPSAMSRETLNLTPAVYQYLLDISLREPPSQRRLREETAAHPNANLQISPDQGQFMALLVKLMGARRIIEVGVFTGYSSLWMALALPDDGRLVACDVNREWTGIARRYWDEAGIGHKVDLRLAPALDTMD